MPEYVLLKTIFVVGDHRNAKTKFKEKSQKEIFFYKYSIAHTQTSNKIEKNVRTRVTETNIQTNQQKNVSLIEINMKLKQKKLQFCVQWLSFSNFVCSISQLWPRTLQISPPPLTKQVTNRLCVVSFFCCANCIPFVIRFEIDSFNYSEKCGIATVSNIKWIKRRRIER